MKRSSKESRWAELPPARTRFAAEAAFLILVAVGAALAQLSPRAIIGLMLVAWLLVALIERASSREQATAPVGSEGTDATELPEPESKPEPEAQVELPADERRPRIAFRRLSWRRARIAVEPLEAPTAALEDRPSRGNVRRIEPEPSSTADVVELETVVTEVAVAEVQSPGPAVTRRPLDLPGLEEPEAERAAVPPEPEAPPTEPSVETAALVEAPPSPEPQRVIEPPPPEPARAPPAPPPPAREWNIWDLERRARAQAGDPLRNEEWAAIFMHLRQFANADGVLPMQFDDLVRESFPELIQAA